MSNLLTFSQTGTQAIRWLPVMNTGVTDIPQYAPMLITGAILSARQVVFQVGAPTSDSQDEQDVRRHLINGPEPIRRQGIGRGTRDWPVQAAYDDSDGSIQVGDGLGFQQNSFLLHPADRPFVCLSTDPASNSSRPTCWVAPEGYANARFQYPGGGTVTGGTYSASQTVVLDPTYGTSPAGPSVFGHASYCEEIASGSGKGIKVLKAGIYFVWFNGSLWIQSTDPVNDEAEVTLSFYRTRDGSSGVTGVRTSQRYSLVSASSGTAYLHSGAESVSMVGLIECDADDILDVRITTDVAFDGDVTWYGAGFGCYKIG